MDHPHGLAVDLDLTLERAEQDLRSFDGARVFLTGGTGFVGSWMLELIEWACDRLAISPELLLLTRDPERFASQRPHLASHSAVTLLRGDVRRPPALIGKVDIMIAGASANLAAGDGRDEHDVRATAAAGALLARRLIDEQACRVLYLSSGAAAPEQPDAYGQAKLDAERLLLGDPGGSSTVVARLFAFVGPYLPLDLSFAVGNFLADALARRPIEVAGDGTPIRSYLYAADLAWWLWSLAARGPAGHVCDVGSPEGVTIRELADAAARLADPPLSVRVHHRPTESSAPSIYLPDLDAAGRLGLVAAVPLRSALSRTYDWHRARTSLGSGEVAADL